MKGYLNNYNSNNNGEESTVYLHFKRLWAWGIGRCRYRYTGDMYELWGAWEWAWAWAWAFLQVRVFLEYEPTKYEKVKVRYRPSKVHE